MRLDTSGNKLRKVDCLAVARVNIAGNEGFPAECCIA